MPEKMREIIAEQLSVDASEIELTSNFKEDLEADSLEPGVQVNNDRSQSPLQRYSA